MIPFIRAWHKIAASMCDQLSRSYRRSGTATESGNRGTRMNSSPFTSRPYLIHSSRKNRPAGTWSRTRRTLPSSRSLGESCAVRSHVKNATTNQILSMRFSRWLSHWSRMVGLSNRPCNSSARLSDSQRTTSICVRPAILSKTRRKGIPSVRLLAFWSLI